MVFYFYLVVMIFGCMIEVCDFCDSILLFQGVGYCVIGVFCDDLVMLMMFCECDGFIFLFFSDFDYVVYFVYGVWGEKMNYGKFVEGVICLMFVFDEYGMIIFVQYNVKVIGYVV